MRLLSVVPLPALGVHDFPVVFFGLLCCSLASLGTMALASRIDVEASDRGLASCFKATNVRDDWAAAFIRTHKPTSLEDFLYLVKSEKWESSLEGRLTAVPELKVERVQAHSCAFQECLQGWS